MKPPGEPSSTKSLGAHTVRFEPPDVLCVVYRGDLSAGEALELNAMMDEFARGKRWILLIGDLRQVGAMPLETRKVWTRTTPIARGVAIIGVGSKLQMVLSILTTAFNLLHRDHRLQVTFFDTEAAARLWIDERRRVLQAE